MNRQAKLYVQEADLPPELAIQLHELSEGGSCAFQGRSWGKDAQGLFATEPVDVLTNHPIQGWQFPVSQVCLETAGGTICAPTVEEAVAQYRQHQGYGTTLGQMAAAESQR